MESNTQISNDVPTALPGFENEDAREKLLMESAEESAADQPDINEGEDEPLEEKGNPKKRGWRVMRIIAGFAVFVGILVFAVSWFFEIGWFAKPQAQAVNRSGQKEGPASLVTEDEKLKMALSMVSGNDPKTNGTPGVGIEPEATTPTIGSSVPAIYPLGLGQDSRAKTPGSAAADPSYELPAPVGTPGPKTNAFTPAKSEPQSMTATVSAANASTEPPGRSLFFGVARKSPAPSIAVSGVTTPSQPVSAGFAPRKCIPFGTLLPIRLVGSIYTLRNSSGLVRMELTRSVEGEGYSYPAGTTVIGNVRGGESTRAFVTIVGLIDPVSGELVKFGGDLLGTDGASGIEGKRRRLTSQWVRFFNGLKETASSVLGSVGALRSGGTVILSEPIRRGSESMSEDLSEALLKNGKEDSFIEVSAGSSGYVLVTDLPDVSTDATAKFKTEAVTK
ncbi:MAG TPA: hypothetical protein PKC65_04300 [Pyrinomonadaceae bacterium]|nr:hypothetical protein [Pyrinomonadaceae bacterium]